MAVEAAGRVSSRVESGGGCEHVVEAGDEDGEDEDDARGGATR